MTTGPKKIENRGGRREGAGRKGALSITEKQIQAMLKEAKRFAKKTGKTIDQILLGIIHDSKDDKLRLTAVKIFKDCTMGKYVEQHITKEEKKSPVVYLPEMLEDPSSKIETVTGREGNA